MRKKTGSVCALIALIFAFAVSQANASFAKEATAIEGKVNIGGGYAATKQLDNMGYYAQIYDAKNGLPTSEANFIIAAEIQQLSDVGRLGPCQWLPAGPEGFPGAKFWSLCIHR